MPTRSTAADELPPRQTGTVGQFEEEPQEREATLLGMWLFLAGEILFFGGLFAGFFIYRIFYPEVFAAASAELHRELGAVNSALLLISSMTMSLAIPFAARSRKGPLIAALAASALLGLAFLGIKGWEYWLEAQENLVPLAGWEFSFPHPGVQVDQAKLFFVLYFTMTGIHAVHLAIGILIVAWLAVEASLGRRMGPESMGVELGALFWHFIDIVWIFVFPMLYLARG